MSTVVTRDVEPGTASDVFRLVARAPGPLVTWAALTLARPGEAFANVCIGPQVPTPERRRFLAAVVDVVTGLGARHLLAVVAARDELLLAGTGPSCRAPATTTIGTTVLVRVVLPAVGLDAGLESGSCLPLDLRLERLPSAPRVSWRAGPRHPSSR